MVLHRRSKQVNYESVSIPKQRHIRPRAYLELHGPSPKGFQLWYMKLFCRKNKRYAL